MAYMKEVPGVLLWDFLNRAPRGSPWGPDDLVHNGLPEGPDDLVYMTVDSEVEPEVIPDDAEPNAPPFGMLRRRFIGLTYNTRQPEVIPEATQEVPEAAPEGVPLHELQQRILGLKKCPEAESVLNPSAKSMPTRMEVYIQGNIFVIMFSLASNIGPQEDPISRHPERSQPRI